MTNKGFLTALIWPLLALVAFASMLWVERTGVQSGLSQPAGGFLPDAAFQADKPQPKTECLVVYDGGADAVFTGNILYVLDGMCVGYRRCDAGRAQPDDLAAYRTVILALTNLDLLQPSMPRIMDWVKAGGRLLLAYPPEPSATLGAISDKLGILNINLDYAVQTRARLTSALLPGGEGQEYAWGDERYGLVVQLADACRVHMVSVEADGDEIPMLWECPVGLGKAVVNNNDAFAERRSRGLVAAAYSLLEDVFCYPVVNASMFFIDDFPAPIPDGHNEYIDRFYDVDVDSFYTNIWFPSMLGLVRQYGLRYTGLLIETYDDQVAPPFGAPAQTERYRYFGNVLLQDGHEIGLHGYNHMPLVPASFDYMGLFSGYRKWGSTEDMAASIAEAIRFSRQTIPGSRLVTYVPPSNVLSEEGRQMLHLYFPQIKVISSVYLQDDLAYGQEFDVGADGIVNLPRIVAGCQVSDYYRWAALSELGFHFVYSHFLHPDDALDPERGASLGWENLSADLNADLQWLYGSAKGIRSLTAQQGAMAVQRYCNLTVFRTTAGGRYDLKLGGFYDEAWLLVRMNKGAPGPVSGGSLQNVCGSLYLLHATADHVVIDVKGGE